MRKAPLRRGFSHSGIFIVRDRARLLQCEFIFTLGRRREDGFTLGDAARLDWRSC